MKSIKRNILYLVGLLCLGVSIITLIYMQSEHTKDYFSKLTVATISVAITTAVIQIFATWLAKLQRKGPVFFINRSEDERFILDVRHRLQKGGCVCYPTSDLITLDTVKETITAQIRASRLIVVLLTPGYEDSLYMQELLRIVKKEKRKNILFFTWNDDISMPQSFRQSVPIPLEGRDTDADMMEYIIFKRLTKF